MRALFADCRLALANRLAILARYRAPLRIRPGLLLLIRAYLLADEAPEDRGSRLDTQLVYPSFFAARAQILGYGGAAEVLVPQTARWAVTDYAR